MHGYVLDSVCGFCSNRDENICSRCYINQSVSVLKKQKRKEYVLSGNTGEKSEMTERIIR